MAHLHETGAGPRHADSSWVFIFVPSIASIFVDHDQDNDRDEDEASLKRVLQRAREIARIPVRLPSGMDTAVPGRCQ